MKLSRALQYSLIFAVVGMATTVVIAYVQRNMLSTHEENIPFVTLGHQLKQRTAQAYLLMAQAIGGDQAINFDRQVAAQLSWCQQALQAAYDGAEFAAITFQKTNDEDTRALIKESIISVEQVTAAARERWEARFSPESQVIGAATTNLAAAQASLETKLDSLIGHFESKIKGDSDYLKALSWISLALVFVSFAVLCTTLYRLQRRNDHMVNDHSEKLRREEQRVETMTHFIEAISAGNYDIQLNHSGEDNLTSTLVAMRDKLKSNTEEDARRNWTTSGLARIGEILRTAASSTTELYDNIITFMVKYTRSNQGGLFILNEDEEQDKFLELVACYAFERKKFLTKRIELGDGLVGQCFLEGQRIHLLEIPQEYVSITSGLGGSNPNSLLLVPMKVNDKIYGVVELASFNKYAEHEIELVEKLAESIASTISTVRVNETTRILLEKTQQQAEEMKSQEEEIRQNMEELEATQEEMKRKQAILEKELEQSQHQAAALREQEKKLTESQDTLQAIVDNIPRAIFWKDRDLKFMGCNRIFAAVAGAQSPRELIGKSDFDMAWSAQADAYRKDDMEVMRKQQPKLDIEEVNINSEGEESWVLTSKVPIISEQGEVVAILGMFEDITARKRKEADIAVKLKEREEAIRELTALKQLLERGKV